MRQGVRAWSRWCSGAGAIALAAVWTAAPAGELQGPVNAVGVLHLQGLKQAELGLEKSGQAIRLRIPANAAFPEDIARATAGAVIAMERAVEGPWQTVTLFLRPGEVLAQARWSEQGVALFFARENVGDSYRLGPGDRLQIMILGTEPGTWQTMVGSDGTVMVPLLGKLRAAQLTSEELEQEITRRLAEGYLVDPQVGVTVTEYVSQWVLVTGFVRAPGRIPLRGGLDLRQALTFAGGFAPEAGESVILQRWVDGSWVSKVFDRGSVIVGEGNPSLVHGDVIVVPMEEYCYIRGEVRKPGPVRWERDLTLQRALAVAGGLSELAKPREIRLYRGSLVQVHDLAQIEDLQAPDPNLEPGDIVVVKRRAL